MSLPCPQREALESLQSSTQRLPKGFDANQMFRLQNGTPLYLLGVSQEADMCCNPNLNIAVFGCQPRKSGPQAEGSLSQCDFCALLTGPEDGNKFTVEGLNLKSTGKEITVLVGAGNKQWYRSIV